MNMYKQSCLSACQAEVVRRLDVSWTPSYSVGQALFLGRISIWLDSILKDLGEAEASKKRAFPTGKLGMRINNVLEK